MHRTPIKAGLLALVTACSAMAASAAELRLETPRDYLNAMRKIQCSLKDGEIVTWYWSGHAYSRVPGEADRRLFAVEGMNIRQCGPLGDARDGSFRLVTREVMLYKDPQTGMVLRSWRNPWTGKDVNVVHVTNDPVNQQLGPTDRAGRPFTLPFVVNGNQWWLTSTVPLFYRNALGGDYQDYIGGKYQATEMFNFFGDVDELANPRRAAVSARVGWVRLSEEVRIHHPDLYRQGVVLWLAMFRENIERAISRGELRVMGEAEVAALAHFLLGTRYFLDQMIEGVDGRPYPGDEVVVSTYLDFVRNGLAK